MQTVTDREGQPLGVRPNDNLIPKLFLSSEKENIKKKLITMFLSEDGETQHLSLRVSPGPFNYY
jgi:hypothetical protein